MSQTIMWKSCLEVCQCMATSKAKVVDSWQTDV